MKHALALLLILLPSMAFANDYYNGWCAGYREAVKVDDNMKLIYSENHHVTFIDGIDLYVILPELPKDSHIWMGKKDIICH